MTARWEDVLDVQLDLSLALSEPGNLTRLQVDGFAQIIKEEHPGPTSSGTMTQKLADRLSAMTFNADPVYVDPDMQTVWEASIDGFRPEPLSPTDLITPAGFLLLPRAHQTVDVHRKQTSWRALLWHPQNMIIHVEGSDLPPEEAAEHAALEMQARQMVVKTPDGPALAKSPTGARVKVEKLDETTFRSSGILIALWHSRGDRDAYDVEMDADHPGIRVPPMTIDHVMPWHWGEDWGDDVEAEGSVMRPLQALWRLMAQTVADVSKARGPAPFRRRWERARWPEKHVTVVRLRRPRHESDREEPGHVDWTHRWIVGGHWRWQWYPVQGSLEACGHRYADGRLCDKSGGFHKQIWISPFQKGPESLPLVVNKARVFELVR